MGFHFLVGPCWEWELEVVDRSAAKEAVLLSAFIAANWLLELISVFSVEIGTTDSETLHLLTHRLRRFIYLRLFLERALCEWSSLGFTPPPPRWRGWR